VTDAGIKHLATPAKLDSLYLADTQVTDAEVDELLKALPMCRIIR
jgi:hypothetical protein